MELEELKRKSFIKVLLRGKSGRGKTYRSADVILRVLEEGYSVLAVDTESELSTSLIMMIEDGGYEDDIVENLEYVQVNSFDGFIESLERQEEFDLVVVDTLDHKHSYVLKWVTDAKLESDADWNQYPEIYSKEKEVMETIGKPKSNIIATLDPDSGKMDKPKGAQTNIHGYFNLVIDLSKSGDDWGNSVRNWVGRGEVIGKGIDNLEEALANEIIQRIED